MYILVIDDNAGDRLLVERELRREFSGLQVEAIGDAGNFEQALAAGQFDLVITDYQLRWSTGIKILQRVKNRYPNCPVIMFTNTGTQEIAVEAMKQGLDDYLIKSPKHYVRLSTAVRLALQRKEERRQLALTEMRLQSLLNQLEVGVFRVVPNEQLIEANRAFLHLLGVESLEALNPQDFRELFSDVPGLEPNHRQERQLKLCNALGQDIWLNISETLNIINGQRVIDGIAEDITEIKRTEALLKHYARRLEILQELDRSILRANSTRDIAQTALNAEYELLPVQLLDVTLFDLEQQQATVLAVRSNGEDVSYGLRVDEMVSLPEWGDIGILQQNQIIAVEDLNKSSKTSVLQRLFEQGIRAWMSVPIIAQGRLIGALSVGATEANTFTEEDRVIVGELANQLAIAMEQSRLREELRHYTEELEQLVRDRTQQLEEANNDLEAYAYSISHDLREPLRGIQGFAQILREDYGDRFDEAGQEWLALIFRAAERMESMIQGLLIYNRLNRFNINLQPLNLNSVLSDALSQLELQIQQTGAQVTVEEPLLEGIGHYPTMVQVMTNLLTNAIKFVTPGVQPRVRVWSEQREQRVCLWVEDNGIGIALADQEGIFGVFERLHAEETYPGTGIGLAIVRRSIERMNGQIGVESEVGQGSRFWIELASVSLDVDIF